MREVTEIELELNMKLARWIGFKSNEPNKEWGRWILWGEPDSKTFIQKRTASGNLNAGLCFTQSLDACFKWLVPEYIKRHGKIETTDMICRWLDTYENESYNFTKPALALCVTIAYDVNKEEK